MGQIPVILGQMLSLGGGGGGGERGGGMTPGGTKTFSYAFKISSVTLFKFR